MILNLPCILAIFIPHILILIYNIICQNHSMQLVDILKIKSYEKIKEFLRTCDLNTEIIFSECLNKNENFALEESKYLFFLLA
mgnify:CR=1 FL=1